jgi:hypothetical protein
MEMASRERSSQMCRQSKEIDKIIAEIDRLDRESKEALIKASEDYLFGVGGRHGVSGGLISRRKLGSISRPTT